MSDKTKTLVRTLQADLGWPYQACVNLLNKHGGDFDKALEDGRSRSPRPPKERRT